MHIQQPDYNLIIRYLDTPPGSPEESEYLGEALESIRPLAQMVVARYASPEEREDMEQEVLIHLMGVLRAYNRNPKNLAAWLATVMRNRAISLWRRRRNKIKAVELHDEYPDDTEIEVEDNATASHNQAAESLAGWLGHRFPSIAHANIHALAEEIVSSLEAGQHAKSGIASLRVVADNDLSYTQAVVVYSASVAWLRCTGWQAAYGDDAYNAAPLEFTLVPEVEMVVGPHVAHVLWGVLRGMNIHFRTR